MLLVLNLKNNYPCARWASWGDSIFKNQDSVISASYIDLFDKTSYCSVAFTYELFKYYFDKENEFTMQLLSLPIVNSYDIIVCLKLLNDIDFRLKDKLSDEIKVAILQLAITLSTHKEVDIRFHAVRLLIWLTDTEYRQQALRRLSQCFDNGNVEIKATILYRIQEIHGDSSIVSYIKQKALVDPNYWVRSIIKKDV